MNDALNRLTELQRRFAERADEGALSDDIPRLSVTPVAGRLHADFFGSPFEEAYQEVLAAVVTPELSGLLASLTLSGPDEGSNGTRHWDLTTLADSAVLFPHLRVLSIEQTRP